MIGPPRRRTVERMARGEGEEPRLTYLAEHYHPGLAVEELGRLAAAAAAPSARAASSTVVMSNRDSPRGLAWPGARPLRRRGGNDADRRSVYAVRRLSSLTRMEEL
jgi:hypothetical protein